MNHHRGANSHPSVDLKLFIISIPLLSAELEQRSQALTEAQKTIEHIALEVGKYAGRNETVERQIIELNEQISTLEQERNQWVQKANHPRRIRPLPLQEKPPCLPGGC